MNLTEKVIFALACLLVVGSCVGCVEAIPDAMSHEVAKQRTFVNSYHQYVEFTEANNE